MSLTGFLFGNVDEEGKLSDTELDDDLKNTLGSEGASDYLTSILGGAVFSDSSERQRKPISEKSAISDEPTQSNEGSSTTGASATALSSVRASPIIKPSDDAIDYSDFNELADDASTSTKKWNASAFFPPTLGTPLGAVVKRAEIDEDYDSDESEDTEDNPPSSVKLDIPPATPVPSSLDEHTNQVGLDKAMAEGSESEQIFAESDDEEIFEDLFDSPTKASKPKEQSTPEKDHVEKDKGVSVSKTTAKSETLPSSTLKRMPSGPLKFTDLFGCKVVRHVKKPRRSLMDDEVPPSFYSHPSVDTRRVFTSNQSISRPKGFLDEVVSSTVGADENTDVYITIDGDTGAVTSQITAPKMSKDKPSEVFKDVPFPLDLEDWESQVIWQDNDTDNNNESKHMDGSKVDQDCIVDAQDLIMRPKNDLLEDYESHIIWDTNVPFQPYTQLQINLNDSNMLFEDANSIKELNAREAERLRLLEGVDRFNLSNDHFYEALQEGKVHRVRQTFGQLIIAHSLPSLRLQPPYFKMRQSRVDLRSWHRPCLQAPVGTTITFSRVRSAKKKKQKHSMENPWAAKDITLKDTADCVLVEYSEEYPLIMSNVGMGSVFVNYYRKRDMQDKSVPRVDLGELFVLDVADISPFLNFGNIEPGQVIPALYNNMFRAPLFQHKVRKTDFLIVKHVSKGDPKWYVRGIKYQYIAGQTYPLQEVPAPHSRKVTTTIKHRLQVAAYRLMNRNQYHFLQMAKLARLFPEYSDLQIRQRLKEFCEYQRKGLGAGYWRPKQNMPIPDEDSLRKMLTPEMLCVFESMRVGQQQLHDAGKLGEEEEDNEEGSESKLSIEELLAPWNLTRNFINATQGKAMLKLYGEGDPTGIGEGFSFIRVSMKDIFLRAGESVKEKLAEIEARPKSAHRYNVAEQQQIYKEEITRIWKSQFDSLNKSVTETEKIEEENTPDNIIVPEINDMYGYSSSQKENSAIRSDGGMALGSATEVSLKVAKELGTKNTAHANFIKPNRKSLVIRRAVKSPYTGELMWRTEVIKDSAVIQAYLRQRRIIENRAHDRDDLFGDNDSGPQENTAGLTAETKAQVARLKVAREKRLSCAREHEKSHMTTFSLPQPNKPKKEVIRKCGNCGQLGHMKTNKKCPRYYEFNPV